MILQEYIVNLQLYITIFSAQMYPSENFLRVRCLKLCDSLHFWNSEGYEGTAHDGTEERLIPFMFIDIPSKFTINPKALIKSFFYARQKMILDANIDQHFKVEFTFLWRKAFLLLADRLQ